MTDYKTLHEDGFLVDLWKYVSGNGDSDEKNIITQAVKGASSLFNGESLKNSSSYIDSNIAKSASKLTCIFPVIVSKAVDIEKAVMVSKAIERKAVSLLQMLFSAYNITNAQSATDYLRRFHKNISSSLDWSGSSVEDMLNYTAESVTVPAKLEPQVRAICEHVSRDIHYTLDTEVNSTPISAYRVKNVLNEIQTGSITMSRHQIFDRTRGPNGQWVDTDRLDNHEKDRLAQMDAPTRTTSYKPGTAYEPNDLRGISSFYGSQVLNTDIKKANEAEPTLMIVNFVYFDKGESQQIANSCVIGVKAYIHYVDPEDIVNRVVLKSSDTKGLFNLIRATTGEIAFFKDFLFAVDRAKVDAVAKSNGSSNKIWKLLELRADRLKAAKATRQFQSGCAAISTLVLSQSEVDYIKQYKRIDLNKTGVAKGILKGYNLMALAIVDDVAEKVSFLYDDGSIDFEALSFMSLEREEAGSMYKKVVNLAMKGR